VRTQIIDEWGVQFNLSETEKGDILGVGMWPFAFSIFLFSLVIDKVGYGRAALVGFVCHLVSTCMLLFATTASMLYWGTFIFALSNGTVESYINPAVASMYPREKTKWLNILHAGWPGGSVLAGVLAISMGDVAWQWKVGLTLLPSLLYGAMLLGTKFPISERVAAGVSYREMLQDFGALGAFIVVYLIALQVVEIVSGNLDAGSTAHQLANGYKFVWPLIVAGITAAAFGSYVHSLGRPIFLILMLIMIPLATTELGIDSWITELMKPEMKELALDAGWILVYTMLIMTILRFCAGAIVHRISPLGLLAISAFLAICGLLFFSKATGLGIFVAATVYGVGKTFFWPTMLGVVAETCPKGGALTLNSVGGVGMLGLSVGMVFLGQIQDNRVARELAAYDQQQGTKLYETYIDEEKTSIFGEYSALDQRKFADAPTGDKLAIVNVQNAAKKNALVTAAIFPTIMLACYLGMILYFNAQGGYRPEVLEARGTLAGERGT
jgi:MFS family permease